MVYRHAVVTALRIYTQHSEDAAKGEVEGHVLKSHGNYIVDHGKSWKNHGIVFLNFCGNPVDMSVGKLFINWTTYYHSDFLTCEIYILLCSL